MIRRHLVGVVGLRVKSVVGVVTVIGAGVGGYRSSARPCGHPQPRCPSEAGRTISVGVLHALHAAQYLEAGRRDVATARDVDDRVGRNTLALRVFQPLLVVAGGLLVEESPLRVVPSRTCSPVRAADHQVCRPARHRLRISGCPRPGTPHRARRCGRRPHSGRCWTGSPCRSPRRHLLPIGTSMRSPAAVGGTIAVRIGHPAPGGVQALRPVLTRRATGRPARAARRSRSARAPSTRPCSVLTAACGIGRGPGPLAGRVRQHQPVPGAGAGWNCRRTRRRSVAFRRRRSREHSTRST